jgi:hypothetical protein
MAVSGFHRPQHDIPATVSGAVKNYDVFYDIYIQQRHNIYVAAQNIHRSFKTLHPKTSSAKKELDIETLDIVCSLSLSLAQNIISVF